MGIISWIILGLIVGILAKWIMPGKDPGGIFVTIIIGIVGAFIGGWIGSLLGLGTLGTFSLLNIVLAIVGALILLGGYRLIKSQS
ncbi:MAG: membrane protein [Candidatus Entotheonella factor]|uniref:Membrane protein n=1 Tax=Entotheonella factor TaxID=1429438 RepID=W4LAN2_ENTF1|nr:MAG: membrane protein [Candidatus Entotheonella factor]